MPHESQAHVYRAVADPRITGETNQLAVESLASEAVVNSTHSAITRGRH